MKLRKNKEYFEKTEITVEKAHEELEKGLKLLGSIDQKIISFFGSHKIKPNHPFYKHCKALAQKLGEENYAILSGGGPGIMQAANSGANLAKTRSIGLRASLLKNEIVEEDIFTDILSFHFLFVRRFIMSIKSEALIFYPGGYGTLNELFEFLVLMQTGITDKIPIICVNKKYWEGLLNWLENALLKENMLIKDKSDLELLSFADTEEEIIDIVKKQIK